MIVTHEYRRTTIAFNQQDVPPQFFDVARQLGYAVRVTGGNFRTHEIVCSEADFAELSALAASPAPATPGGAATEDER